MKKSRKILRGFMVILAIIIAVFVGFKLGQQTVEDERVEVIIDFQYQTKNVDPSGDKLIPVSELSREDLVSCSGRMGLLFADEWHAQSFIDELNTANSGMIINGYIVNK